MSRNRSQRRPGVKTTCTSSTRDLRETAFEALGLDVAAAPEPKDCPSCDGRGAGCGACGGLGFVAAEDWKLALQRAFIAACQLTPACESGDAA